MKNNNLETNPIPVRDYIIEKSDGDWVYLDDVLAAGYTRLKVNLALRDMDVSQNYHVDFDGKKSGNYRFKVIKTEGSTPVELAKSRKRKGLTGDIATIPIIITKTEQLKAEKTMKQIADKYCGRRDAAVMREVNNPAIIARAEARKQAERLKEPRDFDYSLEAELERLLRDEGVEAA